MSTFDVRNYGALGDGRTDDSAAIQRSIDAASAAGGGLVRIGAGVYRGAALMLRDDVQFHLEHGAILRGCDDLTPFEKLGYCGGMFYAAGVRNVSITGEGVIDGNGEHFHFKDRRHGGNDFDPTLTRQGAAYQRLTTDLEAGPYAHGPRPGNMIAFANCFDVKIEGVTLTNPGAWCVHFGSCVGVRFHGVRIDNHHAVPNNDGVHVTSCKQVVISDCTIVSADDAIAITGIRFESHFGPLYRADRDICEQVVVSNCVLQSQSSGLRIGWGHGVVRQVAVSNIVIPASNRGICINARAGGAVEDLVIQNAVVDAQLQHGHWWGLGEAIHLSSVPLNLPGGEDFDPPKAGTIRRVTLSNIRAVSDSGVVCWAEHPGDIREVRLCDSQLDVRRGRLDALYGGNFDLRAAHAPNRRIFNAGSRGAVHLRGVNDSDLRDLRIGGEPPAYMVAAIVQDQCQRINAREITSPAWPTSSLSR